jgi:protoporphyrinogen oxidase
MGGTILMGHKATGLYWDNHSQQWRLSAQSGNDTSIARTFTTDHVISSAPIRELVQSIQPRLSENTIKSAKSLGYRDFLTVTLVLKGEELFDDNWIYIHDPSVKVGRIQNFKSWSPEMVPAPEYNCYGLEYFCFEGDGLWSKPDADLISLARSELKKIGLGSQCEFVKGYVVRQAKAYPIYDEHYLTHVDTIRSELEEKLPNLHLVGRNGMHKYNNQDHAIMTSMLTVQNIVEGQRLYDVWQVNQDAEYHESGDRPAEETSTSGLRGVPSRIKIKINDKDVA